MIIPRRTSGINDFFIRQNTYCVPVCMRLFYGAAIMDYWNDTVTPVVARDGGTRMMYLRTRCSQYGEYKFSLVQFLFDKSRVSVRVWIICAIYYFSSVNKFSRRYWRGDALSRAPQTPWKLCFFMRTKTKI